MTYRIQTYFTALMPESSAAVRLPPIAAAYLPRIVLRCTMISAMMTSDSDEEGQRQAEQDILPGVDR